jgi:hypothetical protein
VKEKCDSDEVLNEEEEDSSWNGDTTAGHGSSFGTFYKFPLDDLTSQNHGERRANTGVHFLVKYVINSAGGTTHDKGAK